MDLHSARVIYDNHGYEPVTQEIPISKQEMLIMKQKVSCVMQENFEK